MKQSHYDAILLTLAAAAIAWIGMTMYENAKKTAVTRQGPSTAFGVRG